MCIPMLTLHSNDPLVASMVVTTNEEKGTMLMKLMFPSKLNGCQIPLEEYTNQLPPTMEITEGQVQWHIVKLSPHKALGADGIPNIILMLNLDIILPYLLQIFQATLTLGVYAYQWKDIVTCMLHKPGNQDMTYQKHTDQWPW